MNCWTAGMLGMLTILVSCPVLADECERLPAPAVSVKRVESPVSINTSLGYNTLTRLGEEHNYPGNIVLGLTQGRSSVRLEISLPTVTDKTGRYDCSSPQITVTYGLNITMYVAREFPQGSCAYKSIYDHELLHVQTYQAHLVNIEKDLAEALNRRFATGKPWRGPAGENKIRLQQELDNRWLPYISREIEKVKSAQTLIDTPEEYARITESCDGAIKRLTGSSTRIN